MLVLEAIAWAGFGLIIGSFLNVLVIRHATGKSVQGRSACMSCGTTLAPLDLVPVVSWLAARGRCRHCGSRVSAQYPLVEALTGAVFLGIGFSPLPLPLAIVGCALSALLIAIVVYDIRHTIIPDRWVYGAIALSLAYFVLSGGPFAWYAVLGGCITALPLYLLWAYSRGAWMGFGDVKLAAVFGWVLGPLAGLEAVFLAFMIGAVIGVGILVPWPYYARVVHTLLKTRRAAGGLGLTMKSEVPFGPFLVCGFYWIWFSVLYGIATPLMLAGFL